MWVELVVQFLKIIYFNNRNIIHAYGTLCILIYVHWCGFKENFDFLYISNYCFSVLDTFSLTFFWLLLLLKINSFVPYLCAMSCGLSSHHFILKWKILYSQFFSSVLAFKNKHLFCVTIWSKGQCRICNYNYTFDAWPWWCYIKI